jgi:hypothetical protein
LEFYLRDAGGVALPATAGIISKWPAKKKSGTIAVCCKKVTEVCAAAILKAKDIAQVEASLAKKIREENAAKAGAAGLVSLENAGDADGSGATRSCATGMTCSGSAARSQMTDHASVARSQMSTGGQCPVTEADGTRLSTKKARFLGALDY